LDEFLIQSGHGVAQMLFFDRTPADLDRPIERLWVRLMDQNLAGVAAVYTHSDHPAPLFAEMARRWQGWPDELVWQSLEGEFALRCRHDRLGHIRIAATLRSRLTMSWDYSWEVQAAIMIEAGQLERLALEAAAFFGRPN
jgi:hypothetical protein